MTESAHRRVDGAHVFEIVWRAYRSLLAKGEESIKATGLGDSDFRVLLALLQEGVLPVNVIGERINLTTGSITTAIDRMEAKWLVVRKFHPTDRRIRLVELTAKGRRLIEKARTQHLADMDEAISCLNREERGTLVGLLTTLCSGR